MMAFTHLLTTLSCTSESPAPPIEAPQDACDSSSWTAVYAGSTQTCGIHQSGCTECWGYDEEDATRKLGDTGYLDYKYYGSADVPDASFKALSLPARSAYGAMSQHVCGLTDQGSLRCWGQIEKTLELPPGGALSIQSATYDTACALDSLGSLHCFGLQEELPTGPFSELTAYSAFCALESGGRVECFGSGYEPSTHQTLGTDLRGGSGFFCTVLPDRSLDCYFHATGKRLIRTGVNVLPAGYRDYCFSGGTLCYLDTNGSVSCEPHNWITPPLDVIGFTALSCGSGHICALHEDGNAMCWGDNHWGQTDVPE